MHNNTLHCISDSTEKFPHLYNFMKNTMVLPCPSYCQKLSIHCPSLSAMYNSLHSSTNHELFERHLCNQGSHNEKYRQFFHCSTSLQPERYLLVYHSTSNAFFKDLTVSSFVFYSSFKSIELVVAC